ncbi:MAG: isoprenylcysteine carboxylmethyltransferase family protein [Erythrobacter sp.]
MAIKVPPPVITLLSVIPMVGIAGLLPATNFQFPGQVLVSVFLVAMGAGLMIVAAVQFKRHATTINPFSPESTVKIVQHGVFSFSRNPMYLGMLLILGGIACYLGNPLNALVLTGFIVIISRVQIKPEERALLAKFGDDYQAYLASVRRWV